MHWLRFGPTNVGRPRVSVQAELDEYGTAVETAGRFGFPSGWPASRRAYHYAEVARVQVWTGDADEAFANLLRARQTAPQQSRNPPMVRETSLALDAGKRRLPDSFISYGVWLGL